MKFYLTRLSGLEGRERTKWKAHKDDVHRRMAVIKSIPIGIGR